VGSNSNSCNFERNALYSDSLNHPCPLILKPGHRKSISTIPMKIRSSISFHPTPERYSKGKLNLYTNPSNVMDKSLRGFKEVHAVYSFMNAKRWTSPGQIQFPRKSIKINSGCFPKIRSSGSGDTIGKRDENKRLVLNYYVLVNPKLNLAKRINQLRKDKKFSVVEKVSTSNIKRCKIKINLRMKNTNKITLHKRSISEASRTAIKSNKKSKDPVGTIKKSQYKISKHKKSATVSNASSDNSSKKYIQIFSKDSAISAEKIRNSINVKEANKWNNERINSLETNDISLKCIV